MNEVRTRAWRRCQNRANSGKDRACNKMPWKPQKNWKLMYLRSEKLLRAKQLGVDYPKRTLRQVLDDEKPIQHRSCGEIVA